MPGPGPAAGPSFASEPGRGAGTGREQAPARHDSVADAWPPGVVSAGKAQDGGHTAVPGGPASVRNSRGYEYADQYRQEPPEAFSCDAAGKTLLHIWRT